MFWTQDTILVVNLSSLFPSAIDFETLNRGVIHLSLMSLKSLMNYKRTVLTSLAFLQPNFADKYMQSHRPNFMFSLINIAVLFLRFLSRRSVYYFVSGKSELLSCVVRKVCLLFRVRKIWIAQLVEHWT